MKLATLKTGERDGMLVVVHKNGQTCAPATGIAPTLQSALDHWTYVAPLLANLAGRLHDGEVVGQPLDPTQLLSPLPRAYEWVDGSAFLNHVILVRKARGAEPPETLRTDPLVYQGGSGVLLAPTEDIPLADEKWGLDFESEICVVLDDTPMATGAAQAGEHIKLVMLANDVTLRSLVPAELAKSFGFFQSKPATAFSPFAVTPDELGESWRDGRLHRRVRTTYNGTLVGDCDGGEMHFSFHDLVAHICKTRGFVAGTIVGSGTVSNEDRAHGISCLAERRMIETIEKGKPETPFMKAGDSVSIEMLDDDGNSIFGKIQQRVVTK
jgi:fumarylacetoacetate (FAA) hydrolase